MRRAAGILIVAIYGLLSVGVHVHLHYCCGELTTIGVVAIDESCCTESDHHDGCGIQHSCCAVEDLNLKLEEEHQPGAALQVDASLPAATHTETFVFPTGQGLAGLAPVMDTGPPLKVPAYCLYCSFVFYG